MTGLMHEKEFSRKSFLKGGGAMIVGSASLGAGLAGKAQAGTFDPFASPGPGNPNAVDSFLMIHADNTASLRSGRIELGQGSTTALMTIAAEELDMDTTQFRHIAFDTGGPTPSPNTGNTGGSSSITTGGPLVRMAAASAKQALLALAATSLGVPVASLTVSKGVVSGGGKTVTYGQLVGDKLFNVTYTGTTLLAGPGSCQAGQPVHAGRHPGAAAVRHPGDRERHSNLCRERPGAGHAARPDRPASRPGRLRRRHEPGAALGRRELDQATSRTSRSFTSATSSASLRRRSTTRSRRPRS